MKNKIKRTPVKKDKIVRTPLVIVKKDPYEDIDAWRAALRETNFRVSQEFKSKVSSEAGYIEMFTDTNLTPTRLYHYQHAWLNDHHKYRHCNKSRQIGQSYIFACEGYSKCQLLKIYTGIFVSYNQTEANEKIAYARALHDSAPERFKKKLTVDRVTALEFEGKLPDGRKTTSRLISHPQREPRGKGFNTDVFLDELAHYQWPRKVYVAALPIITRGLGQLSCASSPLGKSGLFWEIGNDEENYPDFSRHNVFWWDNPDFLNEYALANFEQIRVEALSMPTEERVYQFGSDSIVGAYNNSLLEDFQQEYEINPIDESVSYFPIELINQCTFQAMMGEVVVDENDIYGDNPTYHGAIYPNVNFKIYETIEELAWAISKGKVGKALYAGYDVGRQEDNAEVAVIEEVRDRNSILHVLRFMLTMRKTSFRAQFTHIKRLFNYVPIRMLRVDATGMGLNIAEDLSRKFYGRVNACHFTNENKGEMAKNLKLRFEERSIAIPDDRDLIRQIHSVKRKLTEASNVKFEVEKNRLHHGDKFWALAMASAEGEPAQMHKVSMVDAKQMGTPVPKSVRLISDTSDRLFRENPRVSGSEIMDFRRLTLPPAHVEMLTTNDGIIDI